MNFSQIFSQHDSRKSVFLTFFYSVFSAILLFLTLFFFMGGTSLAADPKPADGKPGDVTYNYANTSQIDVEEFGQFSPERSVGELAQKILTFLMAILGGVAMLGIITGGIMVMSGGVSETGKERGKEILIYSIIGVAVAILAMVIVTLAQTFIYSVGE